MYFLLYMSNIIMKYCSSNLSTISGYSDHCRTLYWMKNKHTGLRPTVYIPYYRETNCFYTSIVVLMLFIDLLNLLSLLEVRKTAGILCPILITISHFNFMGFLLKEIDLEECYSAIIIIIVIILFIRIFSSL